jgi:hypothetical protein
MVAENPTAVVGGVALRGALPLMGAAVRVEQAGARARAAIPQPLWSPPGDDDIVRLVPVERV